MEQSKLVYYILLLILFVLLVRYIKMAWFPKRRPVSMQRRSQNYVQSYLRSNIARNVHADLFDLQALMGRTHAVGHNHIPPPFRRPDRQNNIYTITDESGAASNVNVRYPDFLFLDPTSEEAARIRAQLEKDDKDLPSYDEVMGMRNATTPVALVGAGSSTSVSTADTIIAAPPYSETDPNPIPQIVDQPAVNELPMTATTTSTQPSTSRAARNATTVITLESMPSNTTV